MRIISPVCVCTDRKFIVVFEDTDQGVCKVDMYVVTEFEIK
jgi:hypothetical protein